MPEQTSAASGPAGAPGDRRASDPAAGPPLSADWPDEVAARIESTIGTVRDKTTVPITKLARAVVFGLLIAVGGVIALLLLVIAVVRVLDIYLPFHPYGRRVWVVYAGFGAIFLLLGSFCWSKRTARKSS